MHVVQLINAELDNPMWVKLYLGLMDGGTLVDLLLDPMQEVNVQDFSRLSCSGSV